MLVCPTVQVKVVVPHPTTENPGVLREVRAKAVDPETEMAIKLEPYAPLLSLAVSEK